MATPPEVAPRESADASHPEVEPAPPDRWYDRSSITIDAMVRILDQSPEDFEPYAPEDRFCDYIDGVVYMPSPVSDRHQDQVGFLFDLLNGFRHARDAGKVMLGPAVLRQNEQRKPEPDIFVKPRAPEAGVKAELVIEFLSKSTRAHDLGLKLMVYRDAAIPEIWLWDDRNHSVIVERKVGAGYRREIVTEGILHSSALPGFWLDASWMWLDPLPDPRQCLEAILAGPPA